MAKSKPEASGEAAFTKQQFLGSARYADRRDLVSALLTDDQTYTAAQVYELIQAFLSREAE